MKEKIMFYGGVRVEPGQKYTGDVPLGHTGACFPVTFINGTRKGKTILISSGIHGSEYCGIFTAMELAKELEPEDVIGELIIFHPVNMGAFEERLSYINPVIGDNLNRHYPGDRNGTKAEKLCHYMVNEYIKRVDFVMDLHGGDLHEDVMPYVYVPGKGDPEAVSRSLEAAKLLNVNYMVSSQYNSGFYSCGCLFGVPGMLVERGGSGRWTWEEIALYKRDVYNLLKHFGTLEGNIIQRDIEPEVLTEMTYSYAFCSGVFVPTIKMGDYVKKGQHMAEIRDIYGNMLCDIHAEQDGIVLLIWSALSVSAGDPVFIYGK